MTLQRRRFLTGIATAGVVAVAGCSGGGETTTYEGETVDGPEEAASYLSNTSNFTGSAVDWTDRSEVTVEVGTQANAGYNGFGPAAIAISTGTTVTWDWTGQGAPHNVVAEDGSFNSGAAKIADDVTFSHTFEEAGTYRYYCNPHKTQGMKGVVVVE